MDAVLRRAPLLAAIVVALLVPANEASYEQSVRDLMKHYAISADALPEVRYYYPAAEEGWPLVQSVFPSEGIVPANYGGYYLSSFR
jgi:hypothetical protein